MKDNQLNQLLQKHGKRIKPDELMRRRALKNIQNHWQDTVAKNKKRNQVKWLSIAASLVFIVTAGLFFTNFTKQIDNSPFSKEVYVQGELMVSSDGEKWHENSQNAIRAGTWLKTLNGSYTTLHLNDNSQLRINQNSSIKVRNSNEIELLAGSIYHDADDVITNSPLLISTDFGTIKHIGTRYLVNIANNEVNIAVRNGLVEISNNTIKRQLQAGKMMQIRVDGKLSESEISMHDDLWNWTTLAAEPFTLKGKTLHDFIVWYAHEYGYKIKWNQHENKSRSINLSGQISTLDKSKQIKTVFLSTKFDYEINQGILSIL